MWFAQVGVEWVVFGKVQRGKARGEKEALSVAIRPVIMDGTFSKRLDRNTTTMSIHEYEKTINNCARIGVPKRREKS